jgi:hypothetical protein
MMNAMKLSEAIRMKKKKLLESEMNPEMIGTSPVPDMNAQDVWDNEKKAYIENAVDADPKIDARETMADEPSDDEIRMMDKARMARLSSYFDDLDMSA